MDHGKNLLLKINRLWAIDHGPWTKIMNFASIVFYLVFLIPLVAFFVWLMRQDKRNGKKGLIVLAIMVIGGIIWMYWKTKGN